MGKWQLRALSKTSNPTLWYVHSPVGAITIWSKWDRARDFVFREAYRAFAEVP